MQQGKQDVLPAIHHWFSLAARAVMLLAPPVAEQGQLTALLVQMVSI